MSHRRAAVWLLALATSWAVAAAEAPYRNADQIRHGARTLLDLLLQDGAPAALRHARENSHLDDPKVQANLDWATRTLPDRLAPLGHCHRVTLSDEERFASSFMRFHFVLDCAQGQRQFMLTYRRKTDGWRLNQFYFD